MGSSKRTVVRTMFLLGHYKGVGTFYQTLKNDNGKFTAKDGMDIVYPIEIEYGDFGVADQDVLRNAGSGESEHYNVRTTFAFGEGEAKMEFIEHGILLSDGSQCFLKGMMGHSSLVKITEEELWDIENDFDPIQAPPGPFKIQPENQGKIIWLSGAPGMGKSTSAQILARSHGYVYYEADCFGSMKNPYVPLNVDNPSLAQLTQKPLKGPGMEERRMVTRSCQNIWADLMTGKDYDKEVLMKYYQVLAADIKAEKKRIGGDWAIAHVLLTRELRDNMRTWLGQDLVIVILTMSSEDRRDRILLRHEGSTEAADMMDAFERIMEPVREDEPNTIEVKVTSAMTREEVVALISKEVQHLRN